MFWRGLKIIFLTLALAMVAIPFSLGDFLPAEANRAGVYSLPGNSEKLLGKLNLEQKIGQLFIIGIEGKEINKETEDLIKNFHPGGILLLERNIENKKQLIKLISSLQEIAVSDTGLPLFIAIDQEGGIISRIDWQEKTPQSEIKNKNQAYNLGKIRGQSLKELGINLNLAPLLDTALPGDFIFKRVFNKSPKLIGELAGSLIGGQKEAGIFVAIKHFPGYGKIRFNPEEKLATLKKVPEIFQFKKVISHFPEMVMTSNVIYKNIDKTLPLTFSKAGINFLKKEIGEDVLVISDDLSQNSLLNEFSLKEIVGLPIEAGLDILIFSGWRMSVEKGISGLKELVKEGKIEEVRINSSLLKIIQLKQKLSTK